MTHGAKVEGYYNVTKGNITELKHALALYGPVTVLINTRPKSFKFYDNGIYYDKECGMYSFSIKLERSFNVHQTSDNVHITLDQR